MTDTTAAQENISREIANIDAQRTRYIEEMLSGVDARRGGEIIRSLDILHLLTVSKLGRLAELQSREVWRNSGRAF